MLKLFLLEEKNCCYIVFVLSSVYNLVIAFWVIVDVAFLHLCDGVTLKYVSFILAFYRWYAYSIYYRYVLSRLRVNYPTAGLWGLLFLLENVSTLNRRGVYLDTKQFFKILKHSLPAKIKID